MSNTGTAFRGAEIFDGTKLCTGQALLVQDGIVSAIAPTDAIPEGYSVRDLSGGFLTPGFVDLQVNGGGGVTFNDAPAVGTLSLIAAAHGRLGTTSFLPTLITDTADHTKAAVDAVRDAIQKGVPGICGLHLEGPHLSKDRKGAHDPALIRSMSDADLDLLLAAANSLPSLMVTLAPESVKSGQIRALRDAGAVVSLGHSQASHDAVVRAVAEGATCTTHLFNAMSQISSREPGLVGATLALGDLNAGLIADAIHVHPENIRLALRSKTGPGELFLVTDAMAPAGTSMTEFTLNGRRVCRQNGRLTLADGTLAGADLDMAGALNVMTAQADQPLADALRMSCAAPARVLGRYGELGALTPGATANFVHLTPTLAVGGVWVNGAPVQN